MKKKHKQINTEIETLTQEIDSLTVELLSKYNPDTVNKINLLSVKLRTLQKKIEIQLQDRQEIQCPTTKLPNYFKIYNQ